MSLLPASEMTETKLAAQRSNARKSRGPTTEGGKANSAAANLRHGFYSTSRFEALRAMGEEPEEYLDLMQSLREDLRPRPGLETLLVERMGETVWRMRRAQRILEGLALQNLRHRRLPEQMVLSIRAKEAIEILEPFEKLDAALARAAGPAPEEIQAFTAARREDHSPQAEEFILALQSLSRPMEQRERRAACRKVRARLDPLMESYRVAAWCTTREANAIDSPENLAALMAPSDTRTAFLLRMEDSDLRRLSRLADTLMKIRQGRFQTTKNGDRSHDLDENNGTDEKTVDSKPTKSPEND